MLRRPAGRVCVSGRPASARREGKFQACIQGFAGRIIRSRPRDELDDLAGRNLHGSARARVAAYAFGTLLYVERAQSGQRQPLAFAQGLHRHTDHGVDGFAGLDLRMFASRAMASTNCALFMASLRERMISGPNLLTKICKFRKRRKLSPEFEFRVCGGGIKTGWRFGRMENRCYFCLRKVGGVVDRGGLETVEPQGSGGSNPSLSAKVRRRK